MPKRLEWLTKHQGKTSQLVMGSKLRLSLHDISKQRQQPPAKPSTNTARCTVCSSCNRNRIHRRNSPPTWRQRRPRRRLRMALPPLPTPLLANLKQLDLLLHVFKLKLLQIPKYQSRLSFHWLSFWPSPSHPSSIKSLPSSVAPSLVASAEKVQLSSRQSVSICGESLSLESVGTWDMMVRELVCSRN